MEQDVLTFAQVMAVVVTSVAAFIGIGLGTRVLWRLGSRPKTVAAQRLDDERLQRLEAAVDVIAIEVERISETQRYTAALLAERLPPRDRVGELPGASSARRANNTPH
ncbi:MAG TPA: hypothetical protein VFZ21_04060 [Gemmatimonadaceae bacterium]|jgi:hypothetical protein|nr:hypothetical protein [Gemmatimonadaceae bacterium]